jgi:hypothetical protein
MMGHIYSDPTLMISKTGLLTLQNHAQVHCKPTADLVPFHQGGSSLDLSIQGSKANSQDSPSNLSIYPNMKH